MDLDKQVFRKPCSLVQAIDILCDEAMKLAGLRQARHCQMCCIRLRSCEIVHHFEPAFPVFQAAILIGDKVLVLNRLTFGPYPAR